MSRRSQPSDTAYIYARSWSAIAYSRTLTYEMFGAKTDDERGSRSSNRGVEPAIRRELLWVRRPIIVVY
jgi:hypothetical protein